MIILYYICVYINVTHNSTRYKVLAHVVHIGNRFVHFAKHTNIHYKVYDIIVVIKKN